MSDTTTSASPATTGATTSATTTAPTVRTGLPLLFILGGLSTVGPFSFDMYLPAFPQLQRDLSASSAAIQLTLAACLAGMALGQLIIGPLSDRFGRRRPVVYGLAGYVVISLLCAIAPSAEMLIALRVAQGIAGGVGVAVSRAVVRDLWSGAQAARYFSRLMLVFGIAPIIAPSLGAQVLRFTDWRGIFVFLAAVGGGLALATLRWLPETLPVERRQTGGFGEIIAGARVVLRDRAFLGYTLSTGLAFAGLFAYLSSSSFVLQEIFGLSAQTYGIVFGVNSIGLVALGQVNARLVGRRYGPRRLYFSALIVNAVAGAALVVAAGAGSLVVIVPMLFIVIASLGMSFPNGSALAMDAHPNVAGTASALMGAIQAGIGVLAGPLVAAGGTASGMPMALSIFGFTALALLIGGILTRTRPLAVA